MSKHDFKKQQIFTFEIRVNPSVSIVINVKLAIKFYFSVNNLETIASNYIKYHSESTDLTSSL